MSQLFELTVSELFWLITLVCGWLPFVLLFGLSMSTHLSNLLSNQLRFLIYSRRLKQMGIKKEDLPSKYLAHMGEVYSLRCRNCTKNIRLVECKRVEGVLMCPACNKPILGDAPIEKP